MARLKSYDPWAIVWRMTCPIRRVRLRRGKGRLWLSAKAGLYSDSVGRIERGSRKASVTTLLKIATPLRVPIDQLLQAYEAWWRLRPDVDDCSGSSAGTLETPEPVADAEEAERVVAEGIFRADGSLAHDCRWVGVREDYEPEIRHDHQVRFRPGRIPRSAVPRSPWMARCSPHGRYRRGFLGACVEKEKSKRAKKGRR